ncbi:hypothetical protein ACU8KH_00293 [Lachancea thermotolerans]
MVFGIDFFADSDYGARPLLGAAWRVFCMSYVPPPGGSAVQLLANEIRCFGNSPAARGPRLEAVSAADAQCGAT